MSNLLQKASIITTPTAYNDGKLLSVKPLDYYGPEIVTNGDFAWNAGYGRPLPFLTPAPEIHWKPAAACNTSLHVALGCMIYE